MIARALPERVIAESGPDHEKAFEIEVAWDGESFATGRGSSKREAQRKAAEESRRRLEEEPRFKGKIVTQIVAASTFYPAEEYHQDFYKKNPARYYSYREGCGRDARLKQIWGDAAGGHR